LDTYYHHNDAQGDPYLTNPFTVLDLFGFGGGLLFIFFIVFLDNYLFILYLFRYIHLIPTISYPIPLPTQFPLSLIHHHLLLLFPPYSLIPLLPPRFFLSLSPQLHLFIFLYFILFGFIYFVFGQQIDMGFRLVFFLGEGFVGVGGQR
jgi:hypothetical protein